VLAALFETARHIKVMRREDRYGDRALRLRNRDEAHLAPILSLFVPRPGLHFSNRNGRASTYTAMAWISNLAPP
jgi:hypothetical protein